MSAFVHEVHERNAGGASWHGHPLPLLCDGCAACEDLARAGGLGLDRERFAAAWSLMVAIEYRDDGGYLSAADKALGSALYRMALLLERNFGMDPWRWPVTPA